MANPNQKPFVTNAADEEKLRSAKERMAVSEGDLRKAYLALLETAPGRQVLWDLLDHCGVYRSIFETSARISYNSGKQDVGHYLQAKILEANPSAMIEMMSARLTP